mgnify:FL=1
MFRNYLSIALRNVQRKPGYAFINIFGLAVGMAAFFVISLYISDELSYDSHHENADDLYRMVLTGEFRTGPINSARTSPTWGPAAKEEIPEIRQSVRLKPPNQMWLVARENIKFLEKGFVFIDSTAFDIFSFDLVRGATDQVLAVPFTVVLTETMAEKYFSGEDAIGQYLRLDNAYDFTVTGIMKDVPEQSHFKADFLASLSSLRSPIYGNQFLEQDLNPSIYTYVALNPGADPDVVNAKIDEMVNRRVGPQLEAMGAKISMQLQPIESIHLDSHLDNEILPNGSRGTVQALSAIALFILLIACINYMNLATARSAARSREVGIRKTMGAEQGQLIRQFLGESVIVSGIAMVLAIGLVFFLLPVFNTAAGKNLSILSSGMVSAAGIFIGITLVCGLVAGSYPALFLSRFQPAEVLKGSPSSAASGGGLRQTLVVFQFAISIILMVATVVVFRQLNFTRDMDLGFDREQVLVVQLTDPLIRNEYKNFRDRVKELPSVVSMTGSSSAPGFFVGNRLIAPDDGAPDDQFMLQAFTSDFDFIETLGIEMVAGRSPSIDYPSDTLGAFIINEAAVSAFGWESAEDALQHRVTVGSGPFGGDIIGVFKNFHSESLHEPIEPALVAVANEQVYFYALIRMRGGMTREAIDDIGEIWRDLYPAYIYQYSFLEDDVNALYAADLTLGRLFGGFSFLTILIACMGLFGLASFMAERRTKEIGVRKVMGASMGVIMMLLARDFTKFVLIAFIVGSPIAWIGMNRWLDSFQYRVSFGIGNLLLVGLSVLVISLLTVAYQTIKASLANPVDALKYE